jgi:PAS domain S-box-containing protein
MNPWSVRSGLGAIDAFPEIAWTADNDCQITWLNRRWYEYTGTSYSSSDGVGELHKKWSLAIHPEDRSLYRKSIRTAIAQRVPCEIEMRLRRADNAYRWFQLRAAPLGAPDTPPDGWLGISADIDDHKRLGLRFAFIAKAGEVLAESLDLQTTLDRLLQLIVPEFGDWAAIDLFDEHDRLQTVATTHADKRKLKLVRRLLHRYNHNAAMEPEIAAILRRNRPIVLRDVRDDQVARVAAPEMLETIRALQPRSTVTVPLRARGRTLGSLVAYWAETPHRYDGNDLPLFEELTKRAAVAIENARLFETEREIATEFQHAALPVSLPKIPGIDFDGIYVPASDRALLGGDWYDALRLADGRVVVSIGDVAGSGLPAAVIMASMRQIIRGVAQVYVDPMAMLDAADRTLKTEYPDTFVTAFAAVFDPLIRTLTYASAGHPPPLLRDVRGQVTLLESRGLPLGLRTRTQERAHVVELPHSAFIAFYTDGLIEAERDVIGSQKKLAAAVASSAVVERPNPAKVLFDEMLGSGCNDDVVILTMQLDAPVDHAVAPAQSSRHWKFDTEDATAAHIARCEFVETIAKAGVRGEELENAAVVFGELLGNTVRYAPGPVEIALDWNDKTPVLHVLDRGPGFTVSPRLPADTLSERGRGLYIVWSLAREFNVSERYDGGAHVRAVLAA